MVTAARASIISATAMLSLVSLFSFAESVYGQEAAPSRMSTKFVPDDAIAIGTLTPAELLKNPMFEMFPMEVISVQGREQAGINPMEISMVKVVVGLPGPSGPMFGATIELDGDVDLQTLLQFMNANPEPVKIGDFTVYQVEGPPGTVLHQLNERTLIVASSNYLESIVAADQGTGPLPSLVSKVPNRPGLTILAMIQSVRPMISGIAKQQAQQLPPPVQPLGDLPELIDAMLLQVNLEGTGAKLQLTLLCVDEEAASRVEAILNDSIQFMRQMSMQQMQRGMAQSGESPELQQAMDKYASRMGDMVVKTLTPTRDGRRVIINVESSAGIATTGVLVGLLLPAVQAAREAARRMSGSNNMKQIGLALHNYHAAYNRLPPPAIVNEAGEPLLSWRVAILPFIEQQALYEQFHMDEPWDSEHNLPLSEKLPAVYAHPSAPTPPGHTVYHAVVGDEYAFKSGENLGFRDITDGTSNTVMIVETSGDASVPWSKPEDVEIDPEDPLVHMGRNHQGGFHVVMGDGAVKFITHSIDLSLFNALLTRAGGEVVDRAP